MLQMHAAPAPVTQFAREYTFRAPRLTPGPDIQEVLGMVLVAAMLVAMLVLGTLAANALAMSQSTLPRMGVSITASVEPTTSPVGYRAEK